MSNRIILSCVKFDDVIEVMGEYCNSVCDTVHIVRYILNHAASSSVYLDENGGHFHIFSCYQVS